MAFPRYNSDYCWLINDHVDYQIRMHPCGIHANRYPPRGMQCLKEIGVAASCFISIYSCLTMHHMMFPQEIVHHFSFCYALNIVAVVPAQSTVPKKMQLVHLPTVLSA